MLIFCGRIGLFPVLSSANTKSRGQEYLHEERENDIGEPESLISAFPSGL
jgi:hypothetical protein